MLKSSVWSLALSSNRSTPFEAIQIENEQLIEPVLAIAATEDVHLIVDYTGGMELSHWGFTSDNAGDVEAKLFDSFFEIDKDNI